MDSLFAVKYSFLIPLLPLIGAMLAGFFGAKWLKQNSHWPIWLGVGCSAIISLTLIVSMFSLWHHEQPLFTSSNWFNWIESGNFKVMAGAWIDPLTAVMLCVVTGIGFFITVFAAGYMKGEEGYFRFFAYLGLFIFAMTCLVMGNNLIMLYLGWEGVGVCSYLLIGYYYDRPAAREAAKKAFLVNRIGDFGFGLGIMLIFKAFGTVSYFGNGVGTVTGFIEMAMHPQTAEQVEALKYIPFLLMLGAFGKSAQFPLYVWLPDAMEGPTPVSALIHAATMVTAGVYMIARCSTVFFANDAALTTIAVIGAFTAVFAGSIGLRQFDLKKVFAYSTVSQLGFMFVAMGVLAPVAGVFHLVTHAFFKALLFLSSGVVMHAMSGELDMRKMSGLRKQLPLTNILMLIGCLALAGFPFFSGFFSKDEIIGSTFDSHHPLLGAVMLFAAFMTAYYTFRLYFRVFQGPEVIPAPADGHGHAADHDQADAHAHASAAAVETGDTHDSGHDRVAGHSHDSHGGHGADHGGHHNHEPMLMMVPLFVLAFGALFAGYINFGHHGLGAFLGNSPSFQHGYTVARAEFADAVNPEVFGRESAEAGEPHAIVSPIMIVSALIAIAGIGLAYLMHLKDRARGEALAARFGPLTRLLEGKYWVDEIYRAIIIQPLWALGQAFFTIDRFVVDGAVWAVSFVPQVSGFTLKRTTQRGYLQGYAASMLFGIAVILVIIFI